LCSSFHKVKKKGKGHFLNQSFCHVWICIRSSFLTMFSLCVHIVFCLLIEYQGESGVCWWAGHRDPWAAAWCHPGCFARWGRPDRRRPHTAQRWVGPPQPHVQPSQGVRAATSHTNGSHLTYTHCLEVRCTINPHYTFLEICCSTGTGSDFRCTLVWICVRNLCWKLQGL